jgi:hypothetical protein
MRLVVAGDLATARSGTSSGLSLGSRSVAGTSGPGVSGKLHRERIDQLKLGLCGAIDRQKQPRSNPEPLTRGLRARVFGLRQASLPTIPAAPPTSTLND